jgi:cysteinyl-tRNA synthetase
MLRLYNTRTRSLETFSPLRAGYVRMYVCGLTPSGEPHLGHARSFLFFDIFRRYLRHLGYEVTYVQNVTDIDDRSIEASRQEGRPWHEIIERYYESFKRSMRRLGVAEPDVEPRATQYIPQILAMIEQLVETGHAYAGEDGVYFRVASFERYGKLSGENLEELMIGARIRENEKKQNPLDFALWKFEKPGEPSWPSKFGAGRPGWHIECSAMAHDLLGEPFDIHGGGADLIFPHHENEIAQSESLLPQPPMANFWVHGGLLLFEQRKMSKSLGNYEPLYELLDRADTQAIRLLFLQTGYRKRMNFTEESFAGATVAINKLRKAWRTLTNGTALDFQANADHDGIIARVEEALADDMNTAAALASMFETGSRVEEYVQRGDAHEAARALGYALTMLGLAPDERWLTEPAVDIDIDEVAQRLRARLEAVVGFNGESGERIIALAIEARDRARRTKNFALADQIRDALVAERIELRDTREGMTTWTLAGE